MRFFADLDFSASIALLHVVFCFLRKKSHLPIAQIRLRRGRAGEANNCLLNLPDKESLSVCAWGRVSICQVWPLPLEMQARCLTVVVLRTHFATPLLFCSSRHFLRENAAWSSF